MREVGHCRRPHQRQWRRFAPWGIPSAASGRAPFSRTFDRGRFKTGGLKGPRRRQPLYRPAASNGPWPWRLRPDRRALGLAVFFRRTPGQTLRQFEMPARRSFGHPKRSAPPPPHQPGRKKAATTRRAQSSFFAAGGEGPALMIGILRGMERQHSRKSHPRRPARPHRPRVLFIVQGRDIRSSSAGPTPCGMGAETAPSVRTTS